MKSISGIGAAVLAVLASQAVTAQAPGKPAASAAAVHAAEAAPTQASAAQLKTGEATYKAACLACHQPDGKGLPGAFPPLAGSDYLLKDKTRAISTVIHGKSGPITVNEQKFDSVMPPMTQLSDAEIAGALTYASNSWGNRGWLVSATDVKAVRAGKAPVQTAGSPTEHPGTTRAELKYQGAPSSVPAASAKTVVSPGAPAMTEARVHAGQADLLRALRGLPRRAAQGRDRQAADADITQKKGTDYLKVFIKFGSPAGMPNWGTSGELTDANIDIMARFVQHEPPHPAGVRA